MAKHPSRSRAQPSGQSVVERLAVMETRLDETLKGLAPAIKAAMLEAMADLASASDVSALSGRVMQLESQLAAAHGAGQANQQARTQLQEWARTLTPWFLGVVATVLGLRAFS